MLTDQIRTDMTTAFKAGEALRTSVLKMVLSAFNYKAIDLGHELNDEEALMVLGQEAKKRREAIESYKLAGRNDAEEKEGQELAILETYLPKQMTKQEIEAFIKSVPELQTCSDFPSAMRLIGPMLKGKAPGQLVADSLKALFN